MCCAPCLRYMDSSRPLLGHKSLPARGGNMLKSPTPSTKYRDRMGWPPLRLVVPWERGPGPCHPLAEEQRLFLFSPPELPLVQVSLSSSVAFCHCPFFWKHSSGSCSSEKVWGWPGSGQDLTRPYGGVGQLALGRPACGLLPATCVWGRSPQARAFHMQKKWRSLLLGSKPVLLSSSAQLSGCQKHWGLNTPSCVNPVFKQIILSE